MKDTFEKALKFTLEWEGGYVDHPEDRGGPTNFGITQTTYDAFHVEKRLPFRDVREIKEEEVREIYRKLFWDRIHAEVLPEKLGIAFFDWAVNAGISRATRHLQSCLGVEADAVIGPVTLQAMQQAGDATLDCFFAKREEFYRKIGRGDQEVFLAGWLNRLESLKKYLEKLS